MLTRRMEKMAQKELELENIASLLDKKLDEKFNLFKLELTKDIIDKIKSEIKTEIQLEFKSLIDSQDKKIIELESTVEILRSHVDVLKNHKDIVHDKQEDLEQYGRRVCLRVDGLKPVADESSDVVLEKVEALGSNAV